MLTDDEIDGIKAYIPRLHIARWPKGFKSVPIEKYDGQTNPREWLQLYSTVIRSAGGDSYVMANYLPVCLDPAVRIWLTSLPEESVTSWGDLNRKLIESFQATCNQPGNHFDLTRIKQKGDEALRDYIKRFCAKKTEIPNVPNQQIITTFLGGIHSDDLVREIGRRNHDLKLTAQECLKIADKYALGESALDDIRGKGKEKWSEKPESSKKDKKRKPDNAVNTVDRFRKNPRTNQPSTDELLSGICPWHSKGNHKANDRYYLKDDNMSAYCQELQKLEDKFDGLKFTHVLRDNNQAADELAKIGSSRIISPLKEKKSQPEVRPLELLGELARSD
ncbi:hypothetical protein PR202_gb29184 [Eleusine coracana subsp. coracana]|uniref:Retrotransposon gag domain-containing protein n=1 Tax=Eleusine coracana subsp. coracana TaxID=191504 RepID=A0AAV5FYE9_ELECO|nr:hypothetical protein PR202_gb29184 [Eleusine coracana subsp. coracana]